MSSGWSDMADPVERLRQVVDRDEFAGRFVPHVEHHAGREAPFERHLVDRAGRVALGRRPVVIGRVDMRAGVRDRLDLLDGPTLAVGVNEIGRRHAEELLHLRQPFAVVPNVMNLGRQRLAGRRCLRVAHSGQPIAGRATAWQDPQGD